MHQIMATRNWATTFLVALLFPICFHTSCTKPPDRIHQALDHFRLEPGLRIDLVAAEPLVIDPVAFAFDENLILYVVEDRGYPDPAEGGAPTKLGRVARLEDSDGDGRYDRRTEFVTGLTYPNGVLPWDGGVFVTCAPHIYYFKDTDGDGVADIRRIVLTGFYDTKTAQIRMSHPTLGLDGWIYLTGGLNGGKVISPDDPDRQPVVYTSGDGRFHPVTLEFQVTGGKSQFGLAFDPYGRRFGCSNRHPMQHIVMEPWHLQRNPHLLFTETVENVSKVDAEAKVFPISNASTSADFIPKLIGRSHTGTFTSASGLLIFNGTALSPSHQGNAFICESAQNLVQRQVVKPHGISFRSELAYEGREFLASTDEWFRPVFLTHGPEGALYLADMHRKVIDHPSYVPEEARAALDFESGKSDGRIYRIVRENFKSKPVDSMKFLSVASIPQMVRALESPEAWERGTAHRLLLERRDAAAVPLLKRVAVESELPEGRTRALWLLNSLDGLDISTLRIALSDREPAVREQAVLLGGAFCELHPGLTHNLTSAVTDTDPRVRFTTAIVLGSLPGSAVVDALAHVAAHEGGDRWVRAGILSGIGKRMPEFLAAFRAQSKVNREAFEAVMKDLGQLFGSGGSIEDCRVLLNDVLSSDDDYGWRISTALGLAEGITGRKDIEPSEKGALFALLIRSKSTREPHALEAFISEVAVIAADAQARSEIRLVATELLGYTTFENSGRALGGLLDARNSSELQVKAVASLGRQGDIRGGAFLTEKRTWSNYTPRVRSAVIATLVSKPVLIDVMLSAIEQGVIAPSDIPSADRERLIKNKNQMVSQRAEVLFKQFESAGRMQVYEDYRKILVTSADATTGKTVFARACSACHTYAGTGGDVGPDLTGIKNQPADALLLHTLVPNYEVYPAYQAISVETLDGQSLSGRLIAETEHSLTIRTAFGTDESILRSKISSLSNTGRSLMPEGLEQTMTKEELAHLIAYLKSGG
jgi:putative membrane-bound dehydrogenase-like protein